MPVSSSQNHPLLSSLSTPYKSCWITTVSKLDINNKILYSVVCVVLYRFPFISDSLTNGA